jgi:hypothetical protein
MMTSVDDKKRFEWIKQAFKSKWYDRYDWYNLSGEVSKDIGFLIHLTEKLLPKEESIPQEPNKLDFSKPLRTRDGHEVKIYATEGTSGGYIHGAYKSDPGWIVGHWTREGVFFSTLTGEDPSRDLVQRELPSFRREVWVNVYPEEETHCYPNRGAANAYSICGRIACVKVVLEGKEGDGLP